MPYLVIQVLVALGQVAAWIALLGSLLGLVVLMTFLVQHGPGQAARWMGRAA